MPKVYVGHEFEALKLCYETQVSLLRFLTDLDYKYISGFITIQLVLGGWLALYPVENLIVKIGFLLIDLSVAGIAVRLLYNNFLRRREVSATVINLNEALGYTQKNVYLTNQPLNPVYTFRPWFRWYLITVVTSAVGIVIILFFNA